MHNAIISKLTEVGFIEIPLVGFSSDGASVMVGATNGGATKLRAKFPNMVATHCAAHRLNLAASDVASGVSEAAEDLACRLFAFFTRSSARIGKLTDTASQLDVKFLRLARPVDTRWLSLGEALRTIVRSYPALLAFLATENSSTASRIYAAMSKMPVKFAIFYMADVTHLLNDLSMLLQASDVSILDVRQHIVATCATLDTLSTTDLEKPATSTNVRAFVKEHLPEGLPPEETKPRLLELAPRVRECNSYAAKVATEIGARFPDDASSVLHSFECLSPSSMLL